MAEAATAQQDANVLENTVKILGEGLVAPGTSLMLDGQVVPGLLHVAVGLLARSAFGPLGWFLVAANSYASSTTGKGLLQTAQQTTQQVTRRVRSE